MDPARRAPREWPIAVVLLAAAAAMVVVATGHFKRGSTLFAGAVLLAAALRAVLPTTSAGVLAVRSRWLDVLTAGVLGVGVLVVTLVIPPLR